MQVMGDLVVGFYEKKSETFLTDPDEALRRGFYEKKSETPNTAGWWTEQNISGFYEKKSET